MPMSNNIAIRQEKNKLFIEIDLDVNGNPPREATYKQNRQGETVIDKPATKNWGLATTGGNQILAHEVNGRTIYLGLNVYTPQAPAKKASASK